MKEALGRATAQVPKSGKVIFYFGKGDSEDIFVIIKANITNEEERDRWVVR